MAAPTMAQNAGGQNAGDWVLSQWHGSTQYFPGVVTARDGNTVRVRFDDGSVEDRPANLSARSTGAPAAMSNAASPTGNGMARRSRGSVPTG